MIQTAIISLIKTVNTRCYASYAPHRKALPVITVDLVGSFRNRHHGNSGVQTGLIETDFEISVWGDVNSTVYAQAQSIVSLLENYTGPVQGTESPLVTYSIADIEITSESSGWDGNTEMYTYSVFITVTHTTV